MGARLDVKYKSLGHEESDTHSKGADKHQKASQVNFTKEVKDLCLENWRKKLRKIQISGNIYHADGSEELTSLKYPYYQKQPIDTTQFLLKY